MPFYFLVVTQQLVQYSTFGSWSCTQQWIPFLKNGLRPVIAKISSCRLKKRLPSCSHHRRVCIIPILLMLTIAQWWRHFGFNNKWIGKAFFLTSVFSSSLLNWEQSFHHCSQQGSDRLRLFRNQSPWFMVASDLDSKRKVLSTPIRFPSRLLTALPLQLGLYHQSALCVPPRSGGSDSSQWIAAQRWSSLEVCYTNYIMTKRPRLGTEQIYTG